MCINQRSANLFHMEYCWAAVVEMNQCWCCLTKECNMGIKCFQWFAGPRLWPYSCVNWV